MENFDRGQPRADRNKLESPLEELFAQNIEKYLSPNAEIYPQFPVKTLLGNFRLDFVVEVMGKKVGFECDGKEFHDDYRDEWRDGMILEAGGVDIIYRFRGKDIFSFLEDCIYVVFENDPWLFSDRYPHFFEKLVHRSTIEHFSVKKEYGSQGEDDIINVVFVDDNGKTNAGMFLHTIRRSNDFDGHWRSLARFASPHGGKTLDEVINIYKEQKRC